MNALLIAGSDTHVGKTVLTAALAAYWRRFYGASSLGILKPIQSGIGDCEFYSQVFGLDPAQVTPLRFEAPLAPPLAALQEGRVIDLEQAWQAFNKLCLMHRFVLVEGVGGLGSPVTKETTVADLAWDWKLPTVLVVPVRLGAIGQAVANVALARQARVHLKGIVLNCEQPRSPAEIAQWAAPDLIQTLTGIPIVGTLPYLANWQDLDQLAQAAAQLELERLLPLPYPEPRSA